jgi:lantibiotic protection ABC transporter MutG family permease subunit
MIRILKAEFYKTRHTYLPWIHLILPFSYAIFYFILVKTTGLKNFSATDIIQIYLTILGAVFPIVIGAVTAKTADMEMNAGNYQVILSYNKSRSKLYMAKLLALILGGLLSISIAVGLFGFMFGNQSLSSWLMEIFLIFLGSIAIYIIHLWVSISVGIAASLGLAFVESLLALLSLTGLGDKIWYYIPASWPSRSVASYVVGSQLSDMSLMSNDLIKWCYVVIPITVILLMGSLIHFSKWDGKSFDA